MNEDDLFIMTKEDWLRYDYEKAKESEARWQCLFMGLLIAVVIAIIYWINRK